MKCPFAMDIGKESDQRPKRGAWAPGKYWHRKCSGCREPFMGDKRALECADCAYSLKPEPMSDPLDKPRIERAYRETPTSPEIMQAVGQIARYGDSAASRAVLEKLLEDVRNQCADIADEIARCADPTEVAGVWMAGKISDAIRRGTAAEWVTARKPDSTPAE